MSEVKLSNVIEIISGGTPNTSVEEYWNGNIEWLSVADFNNDERYVYSAEKKITDKGLAESNTKLLQKGDLIISARGTVGALAQLEKPMAFNQSCFGLRGKEGVVFTDFLYYWLKNYVKIFLNKSQGSVFNTINLATFDDIKINLPAYNIQVEIVKLLTKIDQKIAINNQINEELEAMAKTLYDYWFVQFDFPDENGKPYKSSGGKMVYNDQLKREIPEGWGVKQLGELADLYQPQTLSEKDLISNGRYFVYGANGIIGKYNKYNHETPMLAIACRGNSCGVINITQPFSWITGNAMVVKPKFEYICIDYLKYSLLNGNIYKTISGSAQPQITRTNLSPLLLLQADETILSEYADRINSMFSFRIKNFQQNQELTQLRDWLLPMLMNGQVKVE
ncbi:TPA: restriction endonuclease subunit S [Streptococcus suis]|nr:restriction endonuclease subunit S [Streptococcus suis]